MGYGSENLVIKQKLEDAIEYAYCVFRKFPKSERFTVIADAARIVAGSGTVARTPGCGPRASVALARVRATSSGCVPLFTNQRLSRGSGQNKLVGGDRVVAIQYQDFWPIVLGGAIIFILVMMLRR